MVSPTAPYAYVCMAQACMQCMSDHTQTRIENGIYSKKMDSYKVDQSRLPLSQGNLGCCYWTDTTMQTRIR